MTLLRKKNRNQKKKWMPVLKISAKRYEKVADDISCFYYSKNPSHNGSFAKKGRMKKLYF